MALSESLRKQISELVEGDQASGWVGRARPRGDQSRGERDDQQSVHESLTSREGAQRIRSDFTVSTRGGSRLVPSGRRLARPFSTG